MTELLESMGAWRRTAGLTLVCATAVLVRGLAVAAPAPQEPVDPSRPPPATQGASAPEPPPGQTPIEPLGGDRYRIGGLVVDRPAREIRLRGAVVLERGVLEYFACAPGGKLYESLLRADVDPYHLHLGLLLIGLEPENNLARQGDPGIAKGDPVTILVSWDQDGSRVERRAEELLREIRQEPEGQDKSMARTDWVFTGSRFIDGVFGAAMTKSIVAVYNDPTAILNVPLTTGSRDDVYEPYREHLPPVGTEVEILLRAGAERDVEP